MDNSLFRNLLTTLNIDKPKSFQFIGVFRKPIKNRRWYLFHLEQKNVDTFISKLTIPLYKRTIGYVLTTHLCTKFECVKKNDKKFILRMIYKSHL